MKIKVSESTPVQLNWLAAKCNGKTLHYFVDDWFKKDPWLAVNGEADQPLHSYTPTTNWSQGGPIIEREGLTLTHQADRWAAQTDEDIFSYGPTPLIAAMRCYVASKLGDAVEIPDELV